MWVGVKCPDPLECERAVGRSTASTRLDVHRTFFLFCFVFKLPLLPLDFSGEVRWLGQVCTCDETEEIFRTQLRVGHPGSLGGWRVPVTAATAASVEI